MGTPRADGSRLGARTVLDRVVLLALGVTLALLVLEGLLRIAVPQWRGLVAQRFMTTTGAGVLAGVPHFDGRIASLFGDFDVPVRLEGRGFRNPEAADPAAPLIFIGDSFCFGWGVLPEQSFPVLVTEQLGMASYNYCTVGADLLDYLQILRAWLPPGHRGPTVLTVTFENDVLAYPDGNGDGTPSAMAQAVSRSGWSTWLMTHSALFNVTATLARLNAPIVALVRRLGLVSGVPAVSASGVDPIAAGVRLIGRIRDVAGPGPFLVLVVPPRPGQVAWSTTTPSLPPCDALA
jgi:hypothetical protein